MGVWRSIISWFGLRRRGDTSAKAALGPWGEQQAAAFLKKMRYRVIAKNYRSQFGEIDIVAVAGRTIVFVEVKTRSDDDLADPEDAINAERRRRLIRSAAHYLALRKPKGEWETRFDVIAIVKSKSGPPEIRHIESAFDPSDRL